MVIKLTEQEEADLAQGLVILIKILDEGNAAEKKLADRIEFILNNKIRA